MTDKQTPPIKGRWYVVHYGLEHVIGRCVSSSDRGTVMSFRWGTLFRTANFVRLDSVIMETESPRWIDRLTAFVRSIFKEPTP